MKMPPNSNTFAVEFAACILDVELQADHHLVGMMHYEGPNSEEIVAMNTLFNRAGFMVIQNSGPSRMPEFDDEEIEMGYIRGSVDAVDVEFAELVQQTRGIALAI